MANWNPGQELRVAYLGAGGINRTHAKHLEALLPGSGVGVCATSEASAQRFIDGSLTPKARPFADFRSMLDHTNANVLVVGIPPGAHVGQVEEAARRGIALFLEKPIALDLERARGMVEAVQDSGVPTQVGFHMRFSEPVMRLLEHIERGEAGRGTLYQAIYRCHALHGAWWRDVSQSGGQTLEQAIHLYDLGRCLFGEVVRAQGHKSNLAHQEVADYGGEDTAVALLQFESGALGSIASSNAAIPPRWDSPVSALFSNVVLDMPSPSQGTLTHTGNRPAESWWQAGQVPPTETITAGWDPYQKQIEAFVGLLQGAAPSRCPIEEGFASLALVVAVGESSSLGGQAVAPEAL